MVIQGSTVEERRQARAAAGRKRQVTFHASRVRAASNGRERLVYACAYAQAVGANLDDAGRTDLARAIAALVDERRPS
jgi:hypothetical protein